MRLPRRMAPIWVSDPTGSPRPALIASTPAMKVVATAPIPGMSTPSFPSGGAMVSGLFIRSVLLGFFGWIEPMEPLP